MHHQQRDAELIAQAFEETQKRHRVGSAGHGHTGPVARYEQTRLTNVREESLFERRHGDKFRTGNAGLHPW